MSAAVAAAAAASAMNHYSTSSSPVAAADPSAGSPPAVIPPSRYESQKRRDWNTFGQYLKNHRPPLVLARCSGAHVLEFLRYLNQFGKTKVHSVGCPFFGHPHPPAPCPCPLQQAWGSLDALVGRLRAAFEEHGGRPEANPFGARAVRLYLREVRDVQSKARGIAYEKKKRKRPQPQPLPPLPPLSASLPAALPPAMLISGQHSQLSAVVAPAGSQHPFFLSRHHQVDVGSGGGEEADAGARAAAMILPLSVLN